MKPIFCFFMGNDNASIGKNVWGRRGKGEAPAAQFKLKVQVEVAYSDVEAERGRSALPASSDDAYNDEASSC